MNKLTTYIARKAKVTTGACCFLACLATLATSCTSDMLGGDGADTLSGDGKKTPLTVSAGLSNTAEITRAGGDEGFAQNANLLVYLRHTTGARVDDAYPVTTADQAPRLVSLRCNEAGATVNDFTVSYTNTGGGTTTQLYWDDFSNSASETTDLRTDGHGLQSYYGYCYNDGTPTTALTEATGVLGWTADADQTTAEAVKHADLLWSAEQYAVIYAHADKNVGGDHRTITIPYTHAMSEVTIIVNVGEGFTGEELDDAAVTLQQFQNVGTFTAPSQEIAATAKANIQMCPQDRVDKSRKYVAITVPKTNLTVGNVMATITGVDGNDYDIKVTQQMLVDWSEQLVEAPESLDKGMAQSKPLGKAINATIAPGKGYLTKPGVNYQLTVTISKVKIDVQASLADWTTVEATGTGAINFSADVKTIDKDNTITSGSFDIFHAETEGALAYSTTATYTGDKWVNSPNIYWANGSTSYVFRGLASYNGTAPSTVGGSKTAAQGTDLIWATTPAHTGTEADLLTTHNYARGAAINPRTGNVPMEFEHIMSKITMNLVTSSTPAAALTLAGATISISNLSTGGTVNIADGAITPGANVEAAISGMTTAQLTNYCVIPQTLNDASIITITLADGTTYNLQLNECIDDDEDVVGEWERGKHYTYTIYLEKEKITFRAMIKDWVPANGSGNATLEWD